MDDASLEQACVELTRAAAVMEGEGGVQSAEVRARVTSAAAILRPALERQVRAVASRSARLFRDARLEPEDVVQEVLRRLIESPPSNPDARDPVAAVLGWARAVANHVLLDRRRRHAREEGEEATAEVADAERPVEEVLAVRGEIARMVAEARHLAAFKYMHETFRVLVEDPDVSALVLAERVGLIEGPPAAPASAEYRARAKKAAQYAWKLRQRMLDLLAARMGEGRRNIAEEKR